MHYSSEAKEIYSAREGRKTELTADGTDRSREKPAHPGFPGKGVIKQYLLLYLVDLSHFCGPQCTCSMYFRCHHLYGNKKQTKA